MKTATKTIGTMRVRSFVMTKAEALKIQAEQVEHYKQYFPGVVAAVAAATTADKLEDGIDYPMHEINAHIPRGADIEKLLGIK